MSRVVIFGAGGRTGRCLVDEALAAGHQVSAAMRTSVPLPGVESIVADLRDPASVEAAVKGQDVVISAIGPSGRKAMGLYSAAARALVPALEASGGARLIAITSAGVRRDDPSFKPIYRVLARTVMKEAYDDMRLMESIVRSSSVDWTFVRPTRLQDEPATGTYRVQDNETPEGGWQVTRTDVARFIVQEIGKRQWSHAFPTLAE
ncbi:putative NADH-flavin reductase [Kribbella voronezhensis]|uniref:Putative NADH-flavin reductase n=1 Tax=Kribbella voronezhensis TaxID=2512212 RepID=A0A4R7SW24_9ACTN|nr:NAD(P)H-binding protein [Kribbella voronezhensis]TDU83530.1 putative NADH-flavin reductase [Kribbella voronezhensis]